MVTSTVKYRVTLPSQVAVTETRYYFGQVPSTVPSYKKKVPSHTTAATQHRRINNVLCFEINRPGSELFWEYIVLGVICLGSKLS